MVAARVVASGNRMKAEPVHDYLETGGLRKTVLHVPKGKVIFSQGDPADCVFYVQKGRVKISVTSPQGKEATLALQNQGGFIGEECIAASQPLRLATATAIQPCTVLRIDNKEMAQALAEDKSLGHMFQSFLLTRCVLMQADLIDHLFNSSEKRLARTLLLLAQLDGEAEADTPDTTQETLAEMIGTTRSRVSFFMNRFREMGYIQYNGHNGGVRVHRSLFEVLLKE
ncbi:MAG TPA: Crp/Fnr family transcriptional regulator [Candidatus Angelobacter sp.]|nr:Crp/Fnr family transcriptional regulator [Candidatus Angelobacter sp.]